MAFEALKELQATVWGLGPFELVEATISDMHDTLVERLDPGQGDAVLDVGCGTGAIALRAAARGATTTGLDLSPALVERAAQRARDRRLEIEFGVGDAEQLPFADATFDVVASSVGAIFAPDHARVAQELARVTKPGGRLGLSAWRADGSIGAFFRTMSAFQPPPTEGAGSPLAWGDPNYVRSLLGEAFELELSDEISVWDAPSPDAVWDLMSLAFGPLVSLLANLPERRQEMRDALVGLAEQEYDGRRVHQERTYTLIVGRRR